MIAGTVLQPSSFLVNQIVYSALQTQCHEMLVFLKSERLSMRHAYQKWEFMEGLLDCLLYKQTNVAYGTLSSMFQKRTWTDGNFQCPLGF